MAAPMAYLRFSFLPKAPSVNAFYYYYSHFSELRLNPYGLLQHQRHGFCNTSHHCHATNNEGLPGYNYGLPGKGKSRRSTGAGRKWITEATGEMLFGLHPVCLALRAKRRKRIYHLHLDEKYGKRSKKVHPMLHQILCLASENLVDVQFIGKRDLDFMSGNRPHQGVCLDVEEMECLSWDETTFPEWDVEDLPLWLFLQNIQDPMNFGAILRSSYFMGIDKVIVPSKNSCRLSPVVSKASSGVMEVIDLLKLPQETTDDAFCQWWKFHGGMILGTHGSTISHDEDNTKCVALQNFTMSRPSLLVLGNEGTGLHHDIARLCDVRLHIQSQQTGYQQEIDSLNVSVATGILLHWLRGKKAMTEI